MTSVAYPSIISIFNYVFWNVIFNDIRFKWNGEKTFTHIQSLFITLLGSCNLLFNILFNFNENIFF